MRSMQAYVTILSNRQTIGVARGGGAGGPGPPNQNTTNDKKL